MSVTRVAIMLNTYVRGRMGGMGVFAEELVTHLSTDSTQLSYCDVYSTGNEPIVPTRTNRRVSAVNSGVGGIARLLNYGFNKMFGRKLRRQIGPVDLAFFPLNSVTVNARPRIGNVVTIHDLQHRDLGQYFSRAQKIYRWLTYERPAKKALAIVVDSDFTGGTVESFIGVEPARIRTIYPGIDHDFYRPAAVARDSGDEFVYYPARGLPHKNHRLLCDAIKIVRETRPNLRLVLTGADAHLLGDLPDFVTHEGHVPQERVRELFYSASALVFPSLYEGFGFPPLEAMASGCPVVCSAEGSLPEVCGGAAELVDPREPEDIARGILTVVNSPEGYIERGLRNAQRFTWQQCSAEYEALFTELATRA